jgi:uncharacterized protein DUF397
MTDTDLSRAKWRKRSYSSQNGARLEVATNLPGTVAVRDSKDPEGSGPAHPSRRVARLRASPTTRG